MEGESNSRAKSQRPSQASQARESNGTSYLPLEARARVVLCTLRAIMCDGRHGLLPPKAGSKWGNTNGAQRVALMNLELPHRGHRPALVSDVRGGRGRDAVKGKRDPMVHGGAKREQNRGAVSGGGDAKRAIQLQAPLCDSPNIRYGLSARAYRPRPPDRPEHAACRSWPSLAPAPRSWFGGMGGMGGAGICNWPQKSDLLVASQAKRSDV